MRLRSVIACVWPLLLGVACGSDGEDDPIIEPEDPADLEGIEEVEEGLTDLSAQCEFTTSSGLMELELVAGNVAMISKATDGRVVVNTFGCGGATSTTLKNLAITGGAGAQTVILDYMGGTFALGTATAPGVTVDLGAGTDALKIRGSKLADTYTFGDGIAVNADNNKDVTFLAVETFVVTLSEGNDVFSGAGNMATGNTPFTAAITAYTGAGNDTVRGGDGDDTYFGGDGDDTFQTGTADDGSDIVNGGAGSDTVDYSGRSGALTVTIDAMADDGVMSEGDTVRTDVENVRGGTAGDSITGSSTANTLSGGGGADTLAGGDGADILNGDAGDDIFTEGSATNGGDTFNGGAGADVVTYASRMNAVTVNINANADDGEASEGDKVMVDVENAVGGGGGDTITGSSAANLLDGGPGADTVNGGDGNDTLRGGLGVDTLNGGTGDDTFDEGAVTNGGDTMNGGAGSDLCSYAGRMNDVTMVMDGTMLGGEMSEGDKVATDVENLRGGEGADALTGNALDNIIDGGAGIDTILGLGGDDSIDGDADDDIIDCGDGDGDILLDGTTDAVTVPVNCEL